MACAYRVASARAERGQPEINLHVVPGFGGTQMLPRLAVRSAFARRIALGEFGGRLGWPLAQASTMAFPNLERDPDVQRLLAHHEAVPRGAAARAILEAVRIGLTEGIDAGLKAEARLFGTLVASADGRAGIDRFLARRSLPLPLRHRG
jgi:enoyl-CoA hydratase/carnithine racemase